MFGLPSPTFATAGAELVPPALMEVRAALPELDITPRSAERDEALGLLRGAMIDIAVIEAHDHPAEPADGLVFQPLLRDPFRLLLSRGHRLAERRVIDLAEVADETWIDLRCEVDCCKGPTAAAFLGAGFEPATSRRQTNTGPRRASSPPASASRSSRARAGRQSLGRDRATACRAPPADAPGPRRHPTVADGNRGGSDHARRPRRVGRQGWRSNEDGRDTFTDHELAVSIQLVLVIVAIALAGCTGGRRGKRAGSVKIGGQRAVPRDADPCMWNGDNALARSCRIGGARARTRTPFRLNGLPLRRCFRRTRQRASAPPSSFALRD